MKLCGIVVLISMITLAKSFGNGKTNHFICKNVEDVFESQNPRDPSSSEIPYHQGRPGKRGGQGMKGDIGPQGPQGVVDYEEVDLKLQKKVDQGIEKLMQKYETRISDLQEKVTNINNREDLCKVTYAGKCFWVVFPSASITYSTVDSLCAQDGGTPANIYGKNHYDEIEAYLDLLKSHTTLYTGMSFNTESQAITMYDGTISRWSVKDMTWYPGYPSRNAGWTKLGIHTDRNPSRSQGMHNWPPASTRAGVLCEV